MREAISSNRWTLDIQVMDVIWWMRNIDQPDNRVRDRFNEEFPEWDGLRWEESRIAEAQPFGLIDLDDYIPQVVDWLELNTDAYWEDGEPWFGVDDPCEHELSFTTFEDGTHWCRNCGETLG